MDETLRLWGQNIKCLREGLTADGQLKRNGEPCMTQTELGELLEPPVRQSTIARWEAGQMEPRRRYKPQLANALHTDVRMLFPMVRGVA